MLGEQKTLVWRKPDDIYKALRENVPGFLGMVERSMGEADLDKEIEQYFRSLLDIPSKKDETENGLARYYPYYVAVREGSQLVFYYAAVLEDIDIGSLKGVDALRLVSAMITVGLSQLPVKDIPYQPSYWNVVGSGLRWHADEYGEEFQGEVLRFPDISRDEVYKVARALQRTPLYATQEGELFEWFWAWVNNEVIAIFSRGGKTRVFQRGTLTGHTHPGSSEELKAWALLRSPKAFATRDSQRLFLDSLHAPSPQDVAYLIVSDPVEHILETENATWEIVKRAPGMSSLRTDLAQSIVDLVHTSDFASKAISEQIKLFTDILKSDPYTYIESGWVTALRYLGFKVYNVTSSEGSGVVKMSSQ